MKTVKNKTAVNKAQKPKNMQAKRTKCEVWTRVMGYHRPVSQFNKGKQSEHSERKHFGQTVSVKSKFGKKVSV